MSVEIAWKQNILVTDFHLLKSLLVVLGFGSQAFVCGFSRQNINSAIYHTPRKYKHNALVPFTKNINLSLSLETNRNLIHRTVGWLQSKLGDSTLDHTSV